MRGLNVFLSLVVLLALSSGCASTRMSKMSERNLSMPVTEAISISKDVMNEHGYDIQVIDPEDGSARLTGEHADGQDVTVDIIPVSDGTSHVKIQVTNQSPRTSAKTILDDIAVRYE